MMKIKNAVIAENRGRPIVMDAMFQDERAATLVLVHGFKGYKDWGAWNLMSDFFVKAGFNFIKFNHSHNGGTATEVMDFPDLEAFGNNNFSIELADIRMVLDKLLSPEAYPSIDPARIALIGHSRGGATSLLTAVEDARVKATVTLNAVTDLGYWMSKFDQKLWKEEGVLYIPNARTGQNMPLYLQFLEDFEHHLDRFSIPRRMTEMKTPLLIIHSSDDTVVDVSQARLLCDSYEKAQSVFLDSGGHTLGARHPWPEPLLPGALQEACQHMESFFRALDWL
jgi:pimeloyl-ACP methyl ester carboxylesterase